MFGFDITLENLKIAPRDRKLTLLMRHSARYPITCDEDVFVVGLTPEGVRLAEEFGSEIGEQFTPGRILAAPVERCKDTANAIMRGAGWEGQIRAEHNISYPFIEQAWRNLVADYPETTLHPSVPKVMDFLIEGQDEPGVLDLMVTHDTNLATLSGYLWGEDPSIDNFPEFLEGMVVWQQEGTIFCSWRGIIYSLAERYDTE